ncbi:MAG: UMP kinase [Malacoplasma sp.]|nr:UMP kinase [Malacoplasma sp.]
MNNRKLIILKISGASLKGENNDIINISFIKEIANQIKILNQTYKIAIVLGGGNIWRGNVGKQLGMPQYQADQMGMLATVMNSLAFQTVLNEIGVQNKVFSTIEMEKIVDSYIVRNILNWLNNNGVAILSCGTGRPYFTTDTGVALSAAELNAEYIMMGKNNVDGVYNCDPNVYPNAIHYPSLTYQKIINGNLGVMDMTAASICEKNKIKTIVFKINEKNAIINTLNQQTKFSLISDCEAELNNNQSYKI